jgi:hypothetical protein
VSAQPDTKTIRLIEVEITHPAGAEPLTRRRGTLKDHLERVTKRIEQDGAVRVLDIQKPRSVRVGER